MPVKAVTTTHKRTVTREGGIEEESREGSLTRQRSRNSSSSGSSNPRSSSHSKGLAKARRKKFPPLAYRAKSIGGPGATVEDEDGAAAAAAGKGKLSHSAGISHSAPAVSKHAFPDPEDCGVGSYWWAGVTYRQRKAQSVQVGQAVAGDEGDERDAEEGVDARLGDRRADPDQVLPVQEEDQGGEGDQGAPAAAKELQQQQK